MKFGRMFVLTVLSSLIMTMFFYGYHFYLIWVGKNLYLLRREALLLVNIAPVIFGILLGAFSLLSKSNKKFSINWVKLVIQGVPAFIIGFPYFFFLIEVPPLHISTAKISVSNLTGVWLGYVIISSLFADNE